MGEIKLLELFGGIGACSKALECIGIDMVFPLKKKNI